LVEKSSIVLLSSTPVFGRHVAVAEEQIDGDGRRDEIAGGIQHREVRGLRAAGLRLDARQQSSDGIALSARMLLRCPAA
jgi:hypothetical protein